MSDEEKNLRNDEEAQKDSEVPPSTEKQLSEGRTVLAFLRNAHSQAVEAANETKERHKGVFDINSLTDMFQQYTPYIGDYRFDVDKMLSMINGFDLMKKIEEDSKIQQLLADENPKPNQKHLIELRQREIVLEAFLNIIRDLPAVPEENQREYINKGAGIFKNYRDMIAWAMYIATGTGYKMWRYSDAELYAMDPAEREQILRNIFDQKSGKKKNN